MEINILLLIIITVLFILLFLKTELYTKMKDYFYNDLYSLYPAWSDVVIPEHRTRSKFLATLAVKHHPPPRQKKKVYNYLSAFLNFSFFRPKFGRDSGLDGINQLLYTYFIVNNLMFRKCNWVIGTGFCFLFFKFNKFFIISMKYTITRLFIIGL